MSKRQLSKRLEEEFRRLIEGDAREDEFAAIHLYDDKSYRRAIQELIQQLRDVLGEDDCDPFDFAFGPPKRRKKEEEVGIGERIVEVQRLVHAFAENPIKHRLMMVLVMYDITDDDLRTLISRYLLERGLVRIQKSVFLGPSDKKLFNTMDQAMRELSEAFGPNDSVVMVPISHDTVSRLRAVGRDIHTSLVLSYAGTVVL